MPSIDEMFPTKYLKAADLQGREITVVISHVELEIMQDGEKKWVAYFQGHRKGVVLNKTNGRTIAGLYGRSEEWIGREVVLFAMDTQNPKGEIVQGLRVRGPNKRSGNGHPAAMGIQGKVDPGYQLSSGPGATPVKQQSAADPDLDEIVPF